jgi:biotin transport system substrate-specific component
MNQSRFSIQNLCHISIFTATIAVMAQISIPIPFGVPLTMQTFAVALAGVVLGAKKGTVAAFVYVLLGVLGVPVFAQFRGGFDLLVGPTGGYILSFPLLAFAAGFGADRGKRLWLALGLVAGSAINFSMGMLQLAFVNQINLQAAFFVGVLPFVLTELIKLAAVYFVGFHTRHVIKKSIAN